MDVDGAESADNNADAHMADAETDFSDRGHHAANGMDLAENMRMCMYISGSGPVTDDALQRLRKVFTDDIVELFRDLVKSLTPRRSSFSFLNQIYCPYADI